MRKENKTLPLDKLELNTGQVEWLPKNPRQWTQTDIDNTAASIREDEDFLEDRPLLVVPDGKRYVVFAGNLRLSGAKQEKLAVLPCVVYYPETDTDFETVKRRALKDNGSFGQWDYDELANCWDDFPLVDFGIPEWPQENEAQRQMKNGGLSTEGREGGEGYKEFIEKFKPKLTTDDCYTPPEVYDVVKDFVDGEVESLDGKKVVRPFFPGGDYEDLAQYAEGAVVVDNPPFSILSKILRFYSANRIKFFLFGPQLTLFSAPDVKGLTYIPVNAPVIYENGAIVSTGFITNMKPGLRIWIPAGLNHRIAEVQRDTTPIDEYVIPPVVVTSARLGKIAATDGGSLEIKENECVYIRNLDDMADKGKGLYGGGILFRK